MEGGGDKVSMVNVETLCCSFGSVLWLFRAKL